MVFAVNNVLCENGFAVIVAPFEADHQLAWLSNNGIIDDVITLDSDLVALGCASVHVKVNYRTGDSVHYTTECIEVAAGSDATEPNTLLSACEWIGVGPAFQLFGRLNKCDYVTTAGIGLVKAMEIMARCSPADGDLDPDDDDAMIEVVKQISPGQARDYAEKFK
jgi:exonuclease-1